MNQPGNAFNDLVAVLDMHPQTVQRLIRSGQLPGRKIARKWFVPRGEFEAFMNGRWQPAQSSALKAKAA